MTDKRKPIFGLVRGVPSAEEIAALFEGLTGRKPTPEDMAEVENILREHGEREGEGEPSPPAGGSGT
jgi:hypothetical protein